MTQTFESSLTRGGVTVTVRVQLAGQPPEPAFALLESRFESSHLEEMADDLLATIAGALPPIHDQLAGILLEKSNEISEAELQALRK